MIRLFTILAATVVLAASIVATGATAGVQVSLLFRDAVKVGADGNGVLAASFATTLSGPRVRYVLLIENGCRPADVGDATKPCPPPVGQLTVTLNGSVVFETQDAFETTRREIALNAIQAGDNQLVIAAGGSPRSSARVSVLAVREPARRAAPSRN
jgi:hypothetical protein